MKKGFMNKKCTEMTGWEVVKFSGILTIAMTALVGIPIGMWLFWSSITEWFENMMIKIKSKFTIQGHEVDDEEDEEL